MIWKKSCFWDSKYNYEENVVIEPEKDNISVSVLNNNFWVKQVFPYLPYTGKFRYDAPQDAAISPVWCFNFNLI